MSKLANIIDTTQLSGEIAYTQQGASVDITGIQCFSAQCLVTVDTPSGKTFNSGVAASLIVQDLTYTAVTRGTAGNSITIAYTAGGTAGAEVVTVVGNAISVQIANGTSTANQIHSAVIASGAATALISCTVSGTGTNTQVTAAATPLASGADSDVNATLDTITITSHGLSTGLVGQLTSTGTLPAGLATATNYYVIVVDTNTIKLASSLANAKAGTAIDITDQGSSGAVNTFTATSISGGTMQLQGSNDGITWNNEGSSQNVTANGTLFFTVNTQPVYRYYSFLYSITAGRFNCSNQILGKGLI